MPWLGISEKTSSSAASVLYGENSRIICEGRRWCYGVGAAIRVSQGELLLACSDARRASITSGASGPVVARIASPEAEGSQVHCGIFVWEACSRGQW